MLVFSWWALTPGTNVCLGMRYTHSSRGLNSGFRTDAVESVVSITP